MLILHLQLLRLVSPNIKAIAKGNEPRMNMEKFVHSIRTTFEHHFIRVEQRALRAIKYDGRKQKARLALEKYRKKKNSWMEANFKLFLSNITFNASKTMNQKYLQRQNAFQLLFLFLSNWQLDDVTTDIQRICYVARLPSASFDNIPIAFETEIKPYYPQVDVHDELDFYTDRILTLTDSIDKVADRIGAVGELIRLKAVELQVSVRILDAASVRTQLKSLNTISGKNSYSEWETVKTGYDKTFPILNEIARDVTNLSLQEFDQGLVTKVEYMSKILSILHK